MAYCWTVVIRLPSAEAGYHSWTWACLLFMCFDLSHNCALRPEHADLQKRKLVPTSR
jgi:hypothetical protein